MISKSIDPPSSPPNLYILNKYNSGSGDQCFIGGKVPINVTYNTTDSNLDIVTIRVHSTRPTHPLTLVRSIFPQTRPLHLHPVPLVAAPALCDRQ